MSVPHAVRTARGYVDAADLGNRANRDGVNQDLDKRIADGEDALKQADESACRGNAEETVRAGSVSAG
jgi:hypothetical protein